MKRRFLLVIAAAVPVTALFGAAPAWAADPFDGTWKVDVSSAKLSPKPDVWMIKDGVYSCSTCTPAVKVPADGKPHAVPGHDYYDMMAVSIVDPHTVSYRYMRDGKLVTESTDTASADGKSLTSSWKSDDNPKHEMIAGKGVMARVAPGPSGSHAVSGSWRRTNDVELSDQVVTIMLNKVGDVLTMKQPTGETYTATIGGAMAPIEGDPAGTMVKLTREGANTVVETDYRKGKPVSRFAMTPMPGGKTMGFVSTDLLTNATSRFTGVLQ
jgi:hypothetical protein